MTKSMKREQEKELQHNKHQSTRLREGDVAHPTPLKRKCRAKNIIVMETGNELDSEQQSPLKRTREEIEPSIGSLRRAQVREPQYKTRQSMRLRESNLAHHMPLRRKVRGNNIIIPETGNELDSEQQKTLKRIREEIEPSAGSLRRAQVKEPQHKTRQSMRLREDIMEPPPPLRRKGRGNNITIPETSNELQRPVNRIREEIEPSTRSIRKEQVREPQRMERKSTRLRENKSAPLAPLKRKR